MHVLDTDHLSLLDRKTSAEAQRLMFRLSPLGDDGVATTIITYEEQMRGWLSWLAQARSMEQQMERYSKLRNSLTRYCRIRILDFDEPVVEKFERLQKQRIRIGTMDLKIAAIALAHDAILLSRNLRDFSKVPGLKVEDWSV